MEMGRNEPAGTRVGLAFNALVAIPATARPELHFRAASAFFSSLAVVAGACHLIVVQTTLVVALAAASSGGVISPSPWSAPWSLACLFAPILSAPSLGFRPNLVARALEASSGSRGPKPVKAVTQTPHVRRFYFIIFLKFCQGLLT